MNIGHLYRAKLNDIVKRGDEMKKFNLEGVLWVNAGEGGWHFITLPCDVSFSIRELFKDLSPGFGSIPVHVKINNTKWDTSIFYDTKENAYLLPIKGAIRKKENLKTSTVVKYSIEVIS